MGGDTVLVNTRGVETHSTGEYKVSIQGRDLGFGKKSLGERGVP